MDNLEFAATIPHGPTLRQTLGEAMRSVRLLSARAALTVLGITVGSGTITVLLHLGRGAADESMRAFEKMGTNLLTINLPTTPASRRAPATLEVPAVMGALPDLTQVAPVSVHYSRLIQGGKAAGVAVIGSTAAFAQVLGLEMAHGRFVVDVDRREPYAVLGARTAAALGIAVAGTGVGDQVRIENYGFTIVGILKPTPGNPMFPIPIDDAIIVPQGAMRRLQSVPQLNSVLVTVDSRTDSDATKTKLKNYFEQTWPGVALDIQAPRQLIAGMRAQSRTFARLLAALGGIALLVSGIGVMNVMLMSVSERRREIGVRLALGARQRDIRNMFLVEALALSFAGALAGTALGVAVSYGYSRFAAWPFEPNAEAIVLGLASPLIVGLFFGLYPAVSAARQQPLAALRDE